MQAIVERREGGKYGLWLEENWLKTHFEPEPIEVKNKDLLEKIAGKLNATNEEVILKEGALKEPHLPEYYLASFCTKINHGFDLVRDDYRWIISCDPIFHPVRGNEKEAQLKYYEPAVNWLELIGAKHAELPQRFESRETLEDNGELEKYLIDPDSAETILEHWEKLDIEEQAAFYYIYLNAEHNFVGAFLVLKEVIKPEEFGKLVTASLGVTPEFSGVTESTFRDGWSHYSRIAEEALEVLSQHKV
ncbi:MAG: hypothetical protein ACNS60_15655 [Candidatus Cyclobacteriaceae bacterium M2_1C_046]